MPSRLSFCALVILLVGCAPKQAAPEPPSALHSAAPDFERRTLAGTSVDTTSLRGKVVVVKFFAKYCRPCRQTLPEAEALHAKYAEEVVFVGVAEDEDEDDARKMVDNYGLTFPVVHDNDKALAKQFNVTMLPTTYVIDTEGVVRWIGRSKGPQADLERAITRQFSRS